MKNKLYDEIRQGKKKPFGVYALCNFGGVAIYDIFYNDKNESVIVSAFVNGEEITDIRTTKIYCNSTGERDYIIRHGKRYYLDLFFRV